MQDKCFTSSNDLTTPVLFLVFNRPDTTKLVFETIKQAKPQKLYVAADGPRENNKNDIEHLKQVKAIATDVDWNCEVKTLFREKNLGCKIAVNSAINWFFENEDEGIILEDDCLPHPSFFRFCEELLEKYRDDERIALISGDNFQFGRKRTEYSYYFSRYPHIWGWASWRRTWKNYDVKMELWPEIRDGDWLHDLLGNKKSVRYWTEIFDSVYQGKIDTWDYQLTFACWVQNALNILPNVNLVSNLGFGNDATHTKRQNQFSKMNTESIKFPLSNPPYVLRDAKADLITEKMHSAQPLIPRVINKIKDISETKLNYKSDNVV